MSNKEYYHKNKEACDKKNKEWREKNKERSKEINRRCMEKHKEKRKAQIYAWVATVEGKYSKYKSNANRRNIEFHLTLEQFKLFWQKPCVYCGGEIETVGLDRIDSKKSYEINNVVSCCSVCNVMKNSHSVEFFINHCKKISDRSCV